MYEGLYPETRHVKERGGPGRGKTVADSATVSAFADDTAAKLGASSRSVREAVQVARAVPKDLRDQGGAAPPQVATRPVVEPVMGGPDESDPTEPPDGLRAYVLQGSLGRTPLVPQRLDGVATGPRSLPPGQGIAVASLAAARSLEAEASRWKPARMPSTVPGCFR